MADDRTAPEPERQTTERPAPEQVERQTTNKTLENEYRRGYDTIAGPLPEGSALTPDQAAGIAPAPATDQSSQDEQ